MARQSAAPQVAAIEPDESLCGLFDLSTGSAETASECDSSDPAAEVLAVDGTHSPPGFPRADGGAGGGDPSHPHDEYLPEPLTSLQREELRRRNMDALRTPIVGETPEARALEDARLANLAERTRLENLQRALDEQARQRAPESSRRQLFLPTQVIPNPSSEFGRRGPYSRIDSALPVGGWQGLVADQSVALGGGKPEFRCFSVAE